ncbi:MAG: YbhB/YbcL family Raf kinase inhibitor-like protein [Rickettsiales bacterium]|jgi:Raf kinase inhibitor-like YbhB/YbcL family protein|nr:YbhB/YbcL family Raf kinase inhibitor-like protein [Rickettsiales bacterium]
MGKIIKFIFLLSFLFALIPDARAWELSSDTISEGESMIADQAAYECDGSNISPDLSWGVAPAGAKSFALVMHDPMAARPNGFYHWIVIDIPATVQGFTKGEAFVPPIREVAGDSGAPGYHGPCPPAGSGKHFYIFTLYALNVETLHIMDGDTPAEAEEIIKAHALHATQITATYQR